MLLIRFYRTILWIAQGVLALWGSVQIEIIKNKQTNSLISSPLNLICLSYFGLICPCPLVMHYIPLYFPLPLLLTVWCRSGMPMRKTIILKCASSGTVMEWLWVGLAGLAGGLGPSRELSEPESPSGHWERCSSSSALVSGLWGIVRGAGHHHWLHCKSEERKRYLFPLRKKWVKGWWWLRNMQQEKEAQRFSIVQSIEVWPL